MIARAFLCLAFAAVVVRAAEPTVRSADVRGLQVGQTTTITLDGDDLGGTPQLMLPFPVKQKIQAGATPKRVSFDVTLDSGAVPGFYHLRVVTDGGVSLPIPIAVDALPQRPFAEIVASLPISLHGTLSGSGVLTTQFTAKAGDKISVEVEAQRLGSKLRPVVHLLDARRRQLAWAWSHPTLKGDARLQATLPADGIYTVSLHDTEYAGAAPGYFRLKIGKWSFADQVFPSIVGKFHNSVELLGPDAPLRVELPKNRSGDAMPLAWPKEGMWSGPRPFAFLSDREELISKGDGKIHDLPEGSVGVSGQLREPLAEDRYRVAVVPGQRVRLELFTESIGSGLHAGLVVRDDKGVPVARADEGPTSLEPTLDYNVPAKVTSINLSILNLQGMTGPYRLTVTPALLAEKPDFRLQTRNSRIVLPVDGRVVVPVIAERRNYSGSIELAASGLPSSVQMSGATIAAGSDGALVTVQRNGTFAATILSWLGRGEDRKERTVLVVDAPLAKAQPWAASELALAPSTSRAAELAIDWRALPSDFGIVPTRKLTLPIKISPASATAPVRLTLLTSQNVPIVNNQPDPNRSLRVERAVELPAKTTDGELSVLVPPDLSSSSYDIAIQAELLSADRRTVVATAYTPVRRLIVRPMLIVNAAQPRVVAKLNPKAATAVEIKGTIDRREGLASDVTLTLTGLPTGVTAPPAVTVKAGTSDFVFKLSLPPTTPPGDIKGLKITGTAIPDPKLPAVRVRGRDAELILAVLAIAS